MQNNGFEHTVDAVAFNGRDSVCVLGAIIMVAVGWCGTVIYY